jgi:uncharacterized membrane protein YuzA (DUF378 family)
MSSEVEQDDDRIRFEPGAVRQMSKQQALIRFAAGAGASLIAALVSQSAGSGPAGPLLALPAILIASLTLIADDDGLRAAIDDSRGAVLGALGLVAFAVIAWRLLGHLPTWAVLVLATLGWAAVSLVLYGAQRLARRLWRPRRQRSD